MSDPEVLGTGLHLHWCECGARVECRDQCEFPALDRWSQSVGKLANGEPRECTWCRSRETWTLTVGVDPGVLGAYAWELSTAAGASLAAGVRSLPVEERRTSDGKTRRRTDAEALARELAVLVAWARPDLRDAELELEAAVEDPPPAPGHGATAAATQHRGAGRVEGVLAGLGFRVRLLSPQAVRRAAGVPGVRGARDLRAAADDGRSEAAAVRERKAANLRRVREVRPDLVPGIGEDEGRADAVLVLLAARLRGGGHVGEDGAGEAGEGEGGRAAGEGGGAVRRGRAPRRGRRGAG